MTDPIFDRNLALAATLLCLSLSPSAVLADGGNVWGGTSKLDPVQTLIDDENFAGAADELQKLLADEPNDPDLLNLLGYTHRQQGLYDDALAYYEKALAEDPEHRGALEYLGELYLQTDRPELAEQQLARLKDLCLFCRERRDLDKAIEKYREAKS